MSSPSPSQVSRLLREAGFTRAGLYPPGPRRGEVRTGGYRVTASSADPAVVRVRYWPVLTVSPDARLVMLGRYAAALGGRYGTEVRRHELVVTDAELHPCGKPDCGRLVSPASVFCCAPCADASAGGYEITAHSQGCDDRAGRR